MEAPRIGCGKRTVFVHTVGRKYVHIRCAVRFTPCKMKLADWRLLEKHAQPVTVKKGIIKERIRNFKKYGGTVTGKIRELAAA